MRQCYFDAGLENSFAAILLVKLLKFYGAANCGCLNNASFHQRRVSGNDRLCEGDGVKASIECPPRRLRWINISISRDVLSSSLAWRICLRNSVIPLETWMTELLSLRSIIPNNYLRRWWGKFNCILYRCFHLTNIWPMDLQNNRPQQECQGLSIGCEIHTISL